MLRNGEEVIAVLPFEHISMYYNYKKVGKIRRLGGRCACCFAEAKHFLLLVDKSNPQGKGRFALYTDTYDELTIDHIVPKHRGGGNSMDNYQVLCLFCNRTKGSQDMTLNELRELIKRIARRLP